jgi:eukaryotic-like serine/threonine-protein kinase
VIGQVVARRFEITGYLGRGGFGSVWSAFDHNLTRDCALKLFHPGIQVFQAFFEAQILVALQGPYILQVFDADSYMDVPYIATARALGSTEQRMNPFGVDPATAIRWIRDALVGLDVCHRRGLLHRDIKASNLFLESVERVQLGDFGVAAMLDENGQAPAHGDWRIRSPEMVNNGMGGVGSDIYSAGTTLYALLSGRYPFQDSQGFALAEAIRTGTCPKIEDLAPHLPTRLVAAVRTAMSVDPAARFASAEEMAAELSRVPTLVVHWSGVTPHPGHVKCWQGSRSSRKGGFTVCVEDSTPPVITTTRIPSGKKIRALCGVVVPARLEVELRKVFRQLN